MLVIAEVFETTGGEPQEKPLGLQLVTRIILQIAK